MVVSFSGTVHNDNRLSISQVCTIISFEYDKGIHLLYLNRYIWLSSLSFMWCIYWIFKLFFLSGCYINFILICFIFKYFRGWVKKIRMASIGENGARKLILPACVFVLFVQKQFVMVWPGRKVCVCIVKTKSTLGCVRFLSWTTLKTRPKFSGIWKLFTFTHAIKRRIDNICVWNKHQVLTKGKQFVLLKTHPPRKTIGT
jgi:hypothetical protein